MRIETKIGVFVAIGLLSLFVLVSQVSTTTPSSENGGFSIKASIADATGLNTNTKIFMNGIKVGTVISLKNNGSEVEAVLGITSETAIPKDSTLTITQESLMGRKIINIIGGKSKLSLHNLDSLENIKKSSSFEDLSTAFTSIAEENRVPLKNTISNLSISSNKLPTITSKTDLILDKITSISTNLEKTLPVASEKFIKIEDQISEVIIENKETTKKAISNASDFFEEGRRAIDKVNNFLDSVNQSALEIGMHTDYMVRDAYTKVEVDFAYVPNSNTKYIASLVTKDDYSDPRIKPGTHVEGDILFSLQYAKTFNHVTFRFGAFESTGGLGLDFTVPNTSLKISTEIYDFNALNDYRATHPHLKTQMRYTLFDNVEIYTGFDDALNKESSNIFFGLGVRFVDDDLKYALGAASLAR